MSTWKIDPTHTDINFSGKHLMVTSVRGKFSEVEGELILDESDPLSASGEIRVGAASVSTGVDQRDEHLRSADFFDVENHPWIIAKTTGVEKKGAGYLVHTDVTIRDITRPVTFEAEFLGIVPGMQGGRHAGFSLTAKVNREEWDLKWNMALEAGGWLVSKEIKLEIDVAADGVVAETVNAAT